MILAASCTLMALVIAGCAAYAAAVLERGHRDGLACLRRAITVRALIAATLLAICAVRTGRAARHPARHARCLAARVLRRIPRRDPDGEPLDPDEARDFITICRGWKHDARPEKSRT